MSFKPKTLRRRRATKGPDTGPSATVPSSNTELTEAPILLRTSRQVRAAYKQRTVPLVTSKGIHGTYTFPAPEPSISGEPQFTADEADPSTSRATGAADPEVAASFPSPPPPSSHTRKRTIQSTNWTARVIPEILPLYHRLLRTTQSLSRLQTMDLPPCSCGGAALKKLTVLCIAFDCNCSFTSF